MAITEQQKKDLIAAITNDTSILGRNTPSVFGNYTQAFFNKMTPQEIRATIDEPLDDQGNTALHLAAAAGSRTLTDFLVKKGADVFVKNVNGKKPSEVAARTAVQLLSALDPEAEKTTKQFLTNIEQVREKAKEYVDTLVAFNSPIKLGVSRTLQGDIVVTKALKELEKITQTQEFIDNPTAYLGIDKDRLDALETVLEGQKTPTGYANKTSPYYQQGATGNIYAFDSSNSVKNGIEQAQSAALELGKQRTGAVSINTADAAISTISDPVADQVKSSKKNRVTFADESGKGTVTERAVGIDDTISLRDLTFSNIVTLTSGFVEGNPTVTEALSDAVNLVIQDPTMVPAVKETVADGLEEKRITAVNSRVVAEIDRSADPAIQALDTAETLSTGDRVLSEEIAVSNAQLNQRLKDAALANNLEEIKQAVADGANIHSLTAEEIATYKEDVQDAISQIKDQIETFIEFARKGERENIQEAVIRQEDQRTVNLWLVNAQDKDGNTASHAAAKAKQDKALFALNDLGADPAITNNNGELAINLSNSQETDRIIQEAALLQRERTSSMSSTVTEYDYQPPAKSGMARFFDFGMAKRAQDREDKASEIGIKKRLFIDTAQEAAKSSIEVDTTRRDALLTELVKLNKELNQSPSSETMLVDQKYGQIVDGQLMTTLANDEKLDQYTQKFLRKLAFQNAIENIPHLGVGYVDKYIDQMRNLDTTDGYQPLQDKLPSISAKGDVILEDKDPLHLAALTNPSLLIRMSRVYDTVDSPNLSLAEKQAREKAGIAIDDKPTESEIEARREAGRTIAVNQPDASGRTVLENLVERAKEIEAENAKLTPVQRAAKAVSEKALGSPDFQLAVMAEMIERETGKLSDEVTQKLKTELERTDEPKLSPNNALRSILEPMVGIVVTNEKHAANLLVKKAANYQAEKAHREEIISTRGALVAASIAFPLVYALKKAGYQDTTIANVEKFAREAGQATGVYASKLGAGYDAPGAILGNLALGLATIPAVAGVVGGVVVVGAAKGYKLSKDVTSWMYNNPKTTAMIATSPIWGSALAGWGLGAAGIALPLAFVGGVGYVGYKYAPIRTLIKHTVGPVAVAAAYTAGVAAYQVYRTSADVGNRIFQRIPKYISNSVQLAPKELHLGNAKKTLDNALDRALDGIPAGERQKFKYRLAEVAVLEKKVLTELAKAGEGTDKVNLSIGKETFQRIINARTQIFADMKLSEEITRDLETLSNKLLKTSVECYEARAHMAQNVLESTAKDAQNQETRLKNNKMSKTFRNAFASVNAPYQWAYNKAFGTPEERAQKSQEKFMADKFNPEGKEDLRSKWAQANLERLADEYNPSNGSAVTTTPPPVNMAEVKQEQQRFSDPMRTDLESIDFVRDTAKKLNVALKPFVAKKGTQESPGRLQTSSTSISLEPMPTPRAKEAPPILAGGFKKKGGGPSK